MVILTRMMAVIVALLIAAAGLPAAAAPQEARSAGAAPPGFVYRQGRQLMLDGRPYRFVGFNAYGMSGCATGVPWTQEQLDDYFSRLRPVSITRTWAFERPGLDLLDRIVRTAEAHGQKLILTLANAGDDCDFATKDLAWYQSGYRTGNYLPWVRTVVARYADSPAVAIWEIMNEPGHHANVDDATMKAFFDDVAATIKSIDPNHLVGTGSMAEYTSGTKDFAFVHSGPNIDVGSLHEYDYDPGSDTLFHSVISRHLAPTLYGMYRAGKPLIVGETGIKLGPTCQIQVTPEARSEAYRQKFDGYFASGAAGVLIWTYTPNPGPETGCIERIRPVPLDPAIAMVRDYTFPTPVTPPATLGALVARHSGKCLEVPGASKDNGQVITQNACVRGAAHQRFRLQPTDGGFYQIVAQHSGKCLDISKESITDSARIVQWDCWGGANQQFRLLPSDNGHHRLIARSSVKCLDVTGGTANNTPVQQYTCYPNGGHQQFKLTP